MTVLRDGSVVGRAAIKDVTPISLLNAARVLTRCARVVRGRTGEREGRARGSRRHEPATAESRPRSPRGGDRRGHGSARNGLGGSSLRPLRRPPRRFRNARHQVRAPGARRLGAPRRDPRGDRPRAGRPAAGLGGRRHDRSREPHAFRGCRRSSNGGCCGAARSAPTRAACCGPSTCDRPKASGDWRRSAAATSRRSWSHAGSSSLPAYSCCTSRRRASTSEREREIYQRLRDIAAEGVAVLLASGGVRGSRASLRSGARLPRRPDRLDPRGRDVDLCKNRRAGLRHS